MKTVNKTMNRRRESGMCAMCGLVECRTFRCSSCNAKHSKRICEIRAGYIRDGKCIQCGMTNGNRITRCDRCKERNARPVAMSTARIRGR
jgi:hypothetical protein